MSNLFQHRGQFKISQRVIEDLPPEVAVKILDGVFVVRCEYDYMTSNFEYMAYSLKFEAVPEAGIAFEYDVLFHRDSTTGEFLEVQFQRT